MLGLPRSLCPYFVPHFKRPVTGLTVEGPAQPSPILTQKLLEGVPQMVVAENTLTSIQMIEPYYAHIRAEANFDRLAYGAVLQRLRQGRGEG